MPSTRRWRQILASSSPSPSRSDSALRRFAFGIGCPVLIIQLWWSLFGDDGGGHVARLLWDWMRARSARCSDRARSCSGGAGTAASAEGAALNFVAISVACAKPSSGATPTG
jgi:hypothetical protein